MGPRLGQAIDWDDVAHDNGFASDRDMLIHWHHVERLSQEAMGRRIGVCAGTIGSRMKKIGVEVRRVSTQGIQGPRLPGGR